MRISFCVRRHNQSRLRLVPHILGHATECSECLLSPIVLISRHPLKVSSQTVAACVPLQLLHCGAYFGPMLYVCSSTYDRNFWDRHHSSHYIGGREEELGWPSADRKGGREEELGWPKVSSLSWPSADQEGECAQLA